MKTADSFSEKLVEVTVSVLYLVYFCTLRPLFLFIQINHGAHFLLTILTQFLLYNLSDAKHASSCSTDILYAASTFHLAYSYGLALNYANFIHITIVVTSSIQTRCNIHSVRPVPVVTSGQVSRVSQTGGEVRTGPGDSAR